MTATTLRVASTAAPVSSSESLVTLRACEFCEHVKLLRDVLPGKKCDYCYKTKCQFCTLKFPLVNTKRGMPKSLKSNSRICATCFSEHWPGKAAASIKGRLQRGVSMTASGSGSSSDPPLSSLHRRRNSEWRESSDAAVARGRESFDEATLRESLSEPPPPTTTRSVGVPPTPTPSLLHRLATAAGLVTATAPTQRDLIHVVDLWMSLFTAAVLLAAVLVQDLALSYRLIVCAVIYSLFLALHPWVHNTVHTGTPIKSDDGKTVVTAAPVTPHVVPRAPSTRVPDVYQSTFVEMKQAFMTAVTDESKWKVVRSVSGGKVYEVATDKPQTLFMLDTFVSGISIAEFISFMNRTDVKDRALWDQNIAAFEVVESFPDDNAKVIYNAQKPFLGGLLSARDFCLLYTSTQDAIIYASVTHAGVPERPNCTRAVVHLAGYHCKEATNDKGERGFMLKYIVQVDIRSNIPSRMVYNGTADNLERMIKTFGKAKKLFGSVINK